MVFRQLIDADTCTYTYILGDNKTKEAIIIDPVHGHANAYLKLLRELDLQLNACLETHIHADHVTAAGLLAEATGCDIVQGKESPAKNVSRSVADGELIHFGAYSLKALYTPGHTEESYSFFLAVEGRGKLFSGDTLLIRGTGRTDFQNGNSEVQYASLFNKLLQLPEDTEVYPGHDYNGYTVSTIGEEKRYNPRLQVADVKQYCQLMNGLNLPRPKMMDVSVPANLICGFSHGHQIE